MKAAAARGKTRVKGTPAARPTVWDRVCANPSLAAAGLIAITALFYLRCLSNGYVFDDHEMIVINRYIGEWSFLWKAVVNDSWWFRDPAHLPQSHYYRPLQDIWLGLNYQVFGLHPAGPHALMVGLHLVAVGFAYAIAKRLIAVPIGGLVAALMFGLLPVHAEAVIWATAIPESLAGTLQLGAFYFYLRYREEGFESGLAWSLMMFAGALFSHESAIACPLLIGAHALVFAKDSAGETQASRYWRRCRTAIALAAPFVILAVIYLAVRWAVLGFIARRDVHNQATLAQIVLTIPTVTLHNLADIVSPWQAGPSHRIVWVNSVWSAEFWMPAASLALFAAACLIAFSGSARLKVYFFSVAWVFIAMAPVLNLGVLYPNALVADRYLYFSSFGYCLLLGQAAVSAAEANPALLRPAIAIAALLAAVYGLSLWQVQRFWHDEIALFGRCIERFPDSGFCHNRLGMALQEAGDLDGAERELSVAFKLDPTDYAAQYDLAMVHAREGSYARAAREAGSALKHLPGAPAGAYVNLAQMYQAAGDRDRSESAFAQAQQMPGGAIEVGLARARASLARKDGAGAERQLRSVLETAPEDPNAVLLLGSALALQKRYDQALGAYEDALGLVPGNPTVRFLIALTLHNLGRDREALTECQLVLRSAPSDPNARALLRLIQHDLQAPGASPAR